MKNIKESSWVYEQHGLPGDIIRKFFSNRKECESFISSYTYDLGCMYDEEPHVRFLLEFTDIDWEIGGKDEIEINDKQANRISKAIKYYEAYKNMKEGRTHIRFTESYPNSSDNKFTYDMEKVYTIINGEIYEKSRPNVLKLEIIDLSECKLLQSDSFQYDGYYREFAGYLNFDEIIEKVVEENRELYSRLFEFRLVNSSNWEHNCIMYEDILTISKEVIVVETIEDTLLFPPYYILKGEHIIEVYQREDAFIMTLSWGEFLKETECHY